MKRYLGLVFVLAVVLMFLAGCGGKGVAPEEEESAPEEQAPVKTTKTVTKAPVVEEEPEEVEAEPARVPAKKIQELLQKHTGRIESLRYMYQDATMKPEEWETWVKGDQMHVKLREMDNVRGDVYVDNIYLDLSSQTAVGYCERNVYRCADPNSPVDVSFAKYYRKTPIEWIESVTYAEKETEEQMQQRTVWKIWFEEDGKKTSMWVDDYYGVPMKIIVSEGSTKNDYNYEDIAFNAVEDSDLEHGYVTATYSN